MNFITKFKNWKLNKEYNCDKLLYLLVDRPDIVTSHNDFIWYNDLGQYHRNYDLPALYYYNIEIEWFLDTYPKRYCCNVDIE